MASAIRGTGLTLALAEKFPQLGDATMLCGTEAFKKMLRGDGGAAVGRRPSRSEARFGVFGTAYARALGEPSDDY